MGASVALWNVVRVTEHVFLVTVVPLQGGLDTDAILFGVEIKHAAVDRGLVAVEVLHERAYSALVLERVGSLCSLINKPYMGARVQK